MESIRMSRISAKRARNYFAADTILWFALALTLGALVALAEYSSWLPCRVLYWFDLPVTSHATISNVIGLSLSQTIYVPLLFLAGLHNTTYYHTSRVICFAFWFLHGVDVWKYMLALLQNSWRHYLSIIPMAAVILSMGWLILRIHLIATAGISTNSARYGVRPSTYVINIVQYWGGVLILQMVFYGLYIWFS